MRRGLALALALAVRAAFDAAPVGAPPPAARRLAPSGNSLVTASKLAALGGGPPNGPVFQLQINICPYVSASGSPFGINLAALAPAVWDVACARGFYDNGGSPNYISDNGSPSLVCSPTFSGQQYSMVNACKAAPAPLAFYGGLGNASCGLDPATLTTCYCTISFVNNQGTQSCTQCPLGTYGSATGLKTPACSGSCPAGTFGNLTGLKTAACSGACAAGFYCPAKSTNAFAVVCPPGFFCPAGAGAPTPCPAGFYCSAQQASGTLLPCPPGYFCPGASAAPTICLPALATNGAYTVTAVVGVPGQWAFACAAGWFGAPLVRVCNTSTGAFSGADIACAQCAPGAPPAPANGAVAQLTPSSWRYTCAPGYAGGPWTLACDAVTGSFGVPTLGCARCAANASYCPGGDDGRTLPCPPGSYGLPVGGLSSPSCSGACAAGFFCPAGSGSSTAVPCGVASFYCPAGSGAPVPVSANFYSTPLGAATAAQRTGQAPCPAAYACAAGVILELNDCASRAIAGSYCPPGVGAPVLCPAGSFCAGGVAGPLACAPATACPVAGLAAQPPCYWNVTTLAGNGTAAFADGAAATAAFYGPTELTIDKEGNFIVSDRNNHRIRRVTPAGFTTTLAGSGLPAYNDGTAASAAFKFPSGVIVLHDSTTIAVADSENMRVRLLSASGVVTTLAGSGLRAYADGAGTSASFSVPFGIAQFSTGELVVSCRGDSRIRLVTLSGVVTTLAGSGVAAFADGVGTAASFANPSGIAVDGNDNVVVADYVNHRIRLVTRAGVVTSLAGGRFGGARGFVDGLGTNAAFSLPRCVAFDGGNNVVVTDGTNDRVRRVTPAGAVTTLAGGGAAAFADGFFGTAAAFKLPHGLAVTAAGVIVVGDELDQRLRLLTCVPCPASFYCASGAPILCPAAAFCPFDSVNATPCPAGTFSAATGAASNATCAPCPAFSFCPLNSTAPTPCPCPDACTASGLAAAPSCSPSPSPTTSPSHTLTPTASQSRAPSPTPTPTVTPPPNSCLSRPEGCANPALIVAVPTLPGAPLTAGATATVAVASWPAVRAPLTLVLPVAPFSGEMVRITCAASTAAFFVVAPPSPLAPCAAPAGGACLLVDSTAPAPIVASFLVAAAAPGTRTRAAAADRDSHLQHRLDAAADARDGRLPPALRRVDVALHTGARRRLHVAARCVGYRQLRGDGCLHNRRGRGRGPRRIALACQRDGR